MADSKKYDGSQWEHSLRKLTTATDTLTTLPADLYADGTTATVGLKGNMSQSGTPTPQNPITPQETGERTTNEWNVTILPSSAITEDSKWQKYDSSVVSTTMYMSCEANTTYYLYTPSSITSGIFRVYTSTSNEIPIVGSYSITVNEKIRSSSPISVFKFTTGANDKMIIVQVTTANSQTMADNAILDRGYKIPISSVSTTTPVYLGEVQTTRKIEKLVLTGDENWNINTSGSLPFFFAPLSDVAISSAIVICTHYSNANIGQTTTEIGIGLAGNAQLRARPNNPTSYTLYGWKGWLSQQYAAGTPVTVWYVLANETTGIVNEPLRKIGNYADTVSGITIPTTAGADSFDVLTTLKPSEVSLSYTGWHDATVKEWDGSQW